MIHKLFTFKFKKTNNKFVNSKNVIHFQNNYLFGRFSKTLNNFSHLSKGFLSFYSFFQFELNLYNRFLWFKGLKRLWNGAFARPFMYMPRLKKGLNNIVPRFERFWPNLTFFYRYLERMSSWSVNLSLSLDKGFNLTKLLFNKQLEYNLVYSSIKDRLLFTLLWNFNQLQNYFKQFDGNKLLYGYNNISSNSDFFRYIILKLLDYNRLNTLKYFQLNLNKLNNKGFNFLSNFNLGLHVFRFNFFFWRFRNENKFLPLSIKPVSLLGGKNSVHVLTDKMCDFLSLYIKNGYTLSFLKFLHFYNINRQNSLYCFNVKNQLFGSQSYVSRNLLEKSIFFSYKFFLKSTNFKGNKDLHSINSFWHTLNSISLWYKFKVFIKYAFSYWLLLEEFNKKSLNLFGYIKTFKDSIQLFYLLLFFSNKSNIKFSSFILLSFYIINSKGDKHFFLSLINSLFYNIIKVNLLKYRNVILNATLGFKNLGFLIYKLKENIRQNSALSLQIREYRADIYFASVFPVIRSLWTSWLGSGTRRIKEISSSKSYRFNEDNSFRSLEKVSPLWKRSSLFLRQKFWRTFQMRQFLASLEDSFVPKLFSNSFNYSLNLKKPDLLFYILRLNLTFLKQIYYINNINQKSRDYLLKNVFNLKRENIFSSENMVSLMQSPRSSLSDFNSLDYKNVQQVSQTIGIKDINKLDLNLLLNIFNNRLGSRLLFLLNNDLFNKNFYFLKLPFGIFFKFLRRVYSGRLLSWLFDSFLEKESQKIYQTPLHIVGDVNFVYLSRRYNSFYISYSFGFKEPLYCSASLLTYNMDNFGYDHFNVQFSLRNARKRVEQRLYNEYHRSIKAYNQIYPVYFYGIHELFLPIISKRILSFKTLWLEYLKLDVSNMRIFNYIPQNQITSLNYFKNSIRSIFLNYRYMLYNVFVRVYEQAMILNGVKGNLSFKSMYYQMLSKWFWLYLISLSN